MATVTKPIALDESLNTTELTPRNIADVLAQELSRITGRNASQVEYDNTESGLTADNVQDALDEIVEDIPTVPSVDIQTAVDEFSTYNGGLLSALKVSLTPNQDLHGYPEPWVGGASKNIIPMTVDAIKTLNSAMPWVDKVATVNGVTFTILTDNADNIIGFDVDGTASLRIDLHLGEYTANGGNYTISGSTGGSYTTWAVWSRYHGMIESQMSLDGAGTFYDVSGETLMTELTVFQGTTLNHQKFYPMLCLSSAPEPTVFVPYTNICPISGHTQVDVDVSDGQATQEQVTVNLGGTYYSGTLDVVTGVFTPDTAMATASDFVFTAGKSDGDLAKVEYTPSNFKNSIEKLKCNMMPYVEQSASWEETEPCYTIANNTKLRVYFDGDTLADFQRDFADIQIIYELATPTPIQLSPTMVKALVGENHLSASLEGQEITESKYKQAFTFDDVIAYIQSLS